MKTTLYVDALKSANVTVVTKFNFSSEEENVHNLQKFSDHVSSTTLKDIIKNNFLDRRNHTKTRFT